MVARAAGLSRFHLTRAFGIATGHSVAGYWRARRLSEAARALADGAPDILAVALCAGYGSHEAFTRAFRDRFGLTPEAVRAAGDCRSLTLTEPIRMNTQAEPRLAEPRMEDRPAIRLAGLKEFFHYSDTAGIPALWQRFGPHIGTLGRAEVEGHAYGVCLNEPGHDDGFLYLAGVELRGETDAPNGLSLADVPAARYAAFRHEGHVTGVQATCAAILGRWLPAAGRVPADGPLMMVEHYGREFDPRTGFGGLDIWIPLRR
jgi:AraC family transcriptional regulator